MTTHRGSASTLVGLPQVVGGIGQGREAASAAAAGRFSGRSGSELGVRVLGRNVVSGRGLRQWFGIREGMMNGGVPGDTLRRGGHPQRHPRQIFGDGPARPRLGAANHCQGQALCLLTERMGCTNLRCSGHGPPCQGVTDAAARGIWRAGVRSKEETQDLSSLGNRPPRRQNRRVKSPGRNDLRGLLPGRFPAPWRSAHPSRHRRPEHRQATRGGRPGVGRDAQREPRWYVLVGLPQVVVAPGKAAPPPQPSLWAILGSGRRAPVAAPNVLVCVRRLRMG